MKSTPHPPSCRAISSLPLVFTLLIAGCILGAGCGGGTSTTATKQGTALESTPTQAATGATSTQFVAQADAACGRVNTEIAATKATSRTAAEVIRVVPRTLSVEQKGIVTLAKLSPPASLSRDWQRMLGYRRTLARELNELLELAKKHDGAPVKSLLASKKRVHASLSLTARKSGFNECGKVGRVG